MKVEFLADMLQIMPVDEIHRGSLSRQLENQRLSLGHGRREVGSVGFHFQNMTVLPVSVRAIGGGAGTALKISLPGRLWPAA